MVEPFILGFTLGLLVGVYLMAGEVNKAHKRLKDFEAAAKTLWNK